jgi:hypothetical protein
MHGLALGSRAVRLTDGGVMGRTDDIGGSPHAPTTIEEVVRSNSDLGDEYDVLVTKKAI